MVFFFFLVSISLLRFPIFSFIVSNFNFTSLSIVTMAAWKSCLLVSTFGSFQKLFQLIFSWKSVPFSCFFVQWIILNGILNTMNVGILDCFIFLQLEFFVLSVDSSHLSCKLWFLGSNSGLSSYLLSLVEQLWKNVCFRGQRDLKRDRFWISSLENSSQNSLFWFYRPQRPHRAPCHAAHHVVFTQPQDKAAKMKTSFRVPRLVQTCTSNQVLPPSVHSLAR